MRFMDLVNDARREAARAGVDGRRQLAGRRSGPTWGTAAVIGVLGGAAGAIAAYLSDPQRGRARRARLIDQGGSSLRRAGRQIGRVGGAVTSAAEGRLQAMREGGSRVGPTDDVTLRDRAESELFRDPSVPKGSINISVERGVLVLRGEVPDPAMRDRLEREAEAIDGVWSVRNLLHLPGEPAEAVPASLS